MAPKKSLTLPKQQRIRSPKEFQKLLASTQKFLTPFFVLKYKKSDLALARLGIVLSKKNFPRAVDRNRLKRLAREVFRTEKSQLPPLDYLVSFRREAAKPEFGGEVISALRDCLRRLNNQ